MQITVHPTLSEEYWRHAHHIFALRSRDREPGIQPATPEHIPVSDYVEPGKLKAVLPHTGADAIRSLSRHYDMTPVHLSSARRPAIATWQHIPTFNHQWCRRLLHNSSGIAWWLTGFFAVFALLWITLIAGAQLDHTALSILMLLVPAWMVAFQLTQLDAVLLKTLVYQFDIWYLWIQVVAFAALLAWSFEGSISAGYIAAFTVPLLAIKFNTLTFDAAVGQSNAVKLVFYFVMMTLYVQMFIRSLASDDMLLRSHRFCVILCTTTLRLLLSCALNVSLYYGKYLMQIASGLLHRRTRFVNVRVPLYVTIHTELLRASDGILARDDVRQDRSLSDYVGTPQHQLQQQQQDGDDDVDSALDPDHQATPRAAAAAAEPSISRDHQLDAVVATRTTMVYMASACDTFPAARLSELLPNSVSTTETYDGVVCVSAFHPVIPYSWKTIHRMARNRTYQYGGILMFIALILTNVFASTLFAPTVAIAINWIMFCPAVAIMVIESSRFDRNMVRATMLRYEWMIICFTAGYVSVFSTWSNTPRESIAANFSGFLLYFSAAAGVFGLSDAAPSYPQWGRVSLALMFGINNARIIFLNYFDPYYERHPVCFLFCSDTAQLALAGHFTMAVFMIKYLWTLLRFPGRSIIACAHLHFAVSTSPATASPEQQDSYSAARSLQPISDDPTKSHTRRPSLLIKRAGVGSPLLMVDRDASYCDVADMKAERVDHHSTGSHGAVSQANRTPPLAPAAPDTTQAGWTRFEDAAGLPYYYHAGLNQTVWELPAAYMNAAAQS